MFKKLFNIKDTEPYLHELDNHIVFKQQHNGDHIEIVAKLNNSALKEIEVQYNYYTVFVDGKLAMDGSMRHIRRFKREFKMPRGADKSGINAQIEKKKTKLRICVPIKHESSLEATLLTSEDDYVPIYGSA
jgi:HSP20 family molecular chaperone IbpA